MHCCTFCLSNYEARPQVKNPRACPEPECQRLRQRANEREWRERHPEFPGANYHTVRREQRKHQILAIVASLQKCLQVGIELMGITFGMDEFSVFFSEFLSDLGLRQINKFWKAEKVCDFANLDGSSLANSVQTS